jgi:ferrous iron transport protein A
MLSVAQLQLGQRAVIAAIQGEDVVCQRLLEMGVCEGAEVEVLGFSPFGDPLEIRLRDYRLSLRRSEAARISVRLLTGGSR